MAEHAKPSQVAFDGELGAERPLASEVAAHESVFRRFRVGVAWNLVATVANQGSTFAANMAVAAVVGQAAFGRYGVVLNTIQLVSAFAGMGIAYTATRYLAEFRDSDRNRAGRVYGCAQVGITALAAIAAALCLLFSGSIADRALNAPELAPLLRVAAASVFFTTINAFRTGVLGGLEAYRSLGLVGVVSGLLYLAACVGGAVWWGVPGAVVGLLLSAILQWLLLGYAVRVALSDRRIVPRYEFGDAEAAIVRRFVVPAAISGLTTAPALWTAQAVLARRPGGFAEVALYTVSYNFLAIVLFLPNVANTVGMTLLNHVLGRRDRTAYARMFWMNLWTSLAITLLGALAILGASPWVLRAYGSGFGAALPVLAILLAAAIPEVLTIALNQVLQSKERMWTAILWVNVPRDSLIILGSLAMVPRFGARGLALAYLAGRVVAFFSIAVATARLGGPRLVIEPELAQA